MYVVYGRSLTCLYECIYTHNSLNYIEYTVRQRVHHTGSVYYREHSPNTVVIYIMLIATQEKQKSIIALRRGGQPVSCDESKLFIDVSGTSWPPQSSNLNQAAYKGGPTSEPQSKDDAEYS